MGYTKEEKKWIEEHSGKVGVVTEREAAEMEHRHRERKERRERATALPPSVERGETARIEHTVTPDIKIPKEAERVESTAEGRPAVFEGKGERYYAPASTMAKMGFKTHSEYIKAQRLGASHGPHEGTLVPRDSILVEWHGDTYRFSAADFKRLEDGKRTISRVALSALKKGRYKVPVTKIDKRGHRHEVFITASQGKKLAKLEGKDWFDYSRTLGLIPRGSKYVGVETGGVTFSLPRAKKTTTIIDVAKKPDKKETVADLKAIAEREARGIGKKEIVPAKKVAFKPAYIERIEAGVEPPAAPKVVKEDSGYIQGIIEEAKRTAQRFGEGEFQERLRAGLAAITGQEQREYYTKLHQYNKDIMEFNREVLRFEADAKSIDSTVKSLDMAAIDDYNRQMRQLEKEATRLKDFESWVDPSSPTMIAIYNKEVDKFNRSLATTEQQRKKAQQAMAEVDDVNLRIDRLNIQLEKMKSPTEPKEPPQTIGNVGRELYEAQVTEYKEATRNKTGIKKTLAVADVVATAIVPLYWTKHWNEMSATTRAINAGIDTIILLPVSRAILPALKSIGTSRNAIKAMLAKELSNTRAMARDLQHLLSKDVAQSFTNVAKSQRQLYKLAARLEKLKVAQKPTGIVEKQVAKAEKSLEMAARDFISKLQSTEKRVVSKAEQALRKRTAGLEAIEYLPKSKVKRSPTVDIDPVDIVSHTKAMASGAAQQVSEKAIIKAKEKAAIARFQALMARDRLPFNMKRYQELQKKAYSLSVKAAQLQVSNVQANYYELLKVRQLISDLSLTMRNLRAPSNIKALSKRISSLKKSEARLEEGLRLGIVFRTVPLSAKVPRDIALLHKTLVKLREEASNLEAAAQRLSKLKPKTRLASVRKAKRLADIQEKLTAIRLKILKAETKLRQQLNRLIDYQHPQAKAAGGLGVRTITPTRVKPISIGTGVATAAKVVESEWAKKVLGLQAVVVSAIGRPLSNTEIAKLRKAVLTPDEIRRIITEIERQQRLAAKIAATPAIGIEAQKKQEEQVRLGIHKMFMEAIEKAPKIQPRPKEKAIPKPALKAVVRTRTPKVLRPKPEIKPLKPVIPRILPKLRLGGSDKEKRKAIKKSQGALCWRQGELHGQDVWQVGIFPYDNEQYWTTVLGRKPQGATVMKGPRSAYQTAKLIRGRGPAKRITGDIGFMDFFVEPKGERRIGLGFKPDPKMETTGDITIGISRTPTITERVPRLTKRGKIRITPKRPALRR